LEVDDHMSKQAFDQVIQRASSDARFKASLSDNFDAAVRPYELTADEKARLAKGLGLSAAAMAHQMPSAIAASHEALSHQAQSHEALSHEALSHEALTHEALTHEALTSEAQTSEAQTSEAQTSEAQTSEAQTSEAQLNQAL
jgi:hypothetical protein